MKHRDAVEVGQTWQDCDKRMDGRRAKVIAVHEEWAVLVQHQMRPTIVAIKNMHEHSTGWKLVAPPSSRGGG